MRDFAKMEDFSDAETDLIATRHHLHAHPELSLQETETARFVAERLERWGYEVTRNVGGHGVVGRLRVGDGNRSIAIRADMDALPIQEVEGRAHGSKTPGVMHACGHDGHTTMLLGAAEHLARTKNFSGTLNLIFQPAEEAGKDSGAKAMIEDGLFERFPCDAIFGLHNHPGAPAGSVLTRSGPIMAAADTVNITIHGKGGHASRPHLCIDPVVVASSIVMALQTIIARSVNSADAAVITVGTFHSGTATNIIPETAELSLSVRTFSDDVRKQVRTRICDVVDSQAACWGARAEIDYDDGYPGVVNSVEETEFATEVARELLGEAEVSTCPLIPGSEDFAQFLQHKPGSFLRLGNGMASAGLHTPNYDFDDESLTTGAALWSRLAERFLQ